MAFLVFHTSNYGTDHKEMKYYDAPELNYAFDYVLKGMYNNALRTLQPAVEKDNIYAIYYCNLIKSWPHSRVVLHGTCNKNYKFTKEDYSVIRRDADRGQAIALYILLKQCENNNRDFQKCMPYLIKSAENGFFLAQYELAQYYGAAENRYADFKKRDFWYKKSSEQGYSWALLNYGITTIEKVLKQNLYKHFSFNWEWPKATTEEEKANYNLGFKMIKQAAEKGLNEAFYPLGMLYTSTEFPEGRNCQKALYWMERAADQNIEDAVLALDGWQRYCPENKG